MNRTEHLVVLRHPEAIKQYGLSRAVYYQQINEGLIPPPFLLGDRSAGQLQHEVQAVIAARVAGKTKEKIKDLVASLIEQRKDYMEAMQ